MGVSEETSAGVHINTMLSYIQLSRSSLIFMLPPSLVLSSIYPTFTVTEVLTPNFVLSRFDSFLLFIIFLTGKILVDLVGGIDYQLC